MTPEAIVRTTLLSQPIPVKATATVEVRRITVPRNAAVGPHRHNGPVFGSIETGSIIFHVDGGQEVVLRAGDVFYEPADTLINRFDATEEGATFLGYFLASPDETPELTPEP